MSGVTGVEAPQKYVWQIVVALHSAPRFAVGLSYYKYYMYYRVEHIAKKNKGLFRGLVRLTFCLNCVENLTLCFVTCVANVENYGKY